MSIEIDKPKTQRPALRVVDIMPFMPNEAIVLIEKGLAKNRRNHKLLAHFLGCCELCDRMDAFDDERPEDVVA